MYIVDKISKPISKIYKTGYESGPFIGGVRPQNLFIKMQLTENEFAFSLHTDLFLGSWRSSIRNYFGKYFCIPYDKIIDFKTYHSPKSIMVFKYKNCNDEVLTNQFSIYEKIFSLTKTIEIIEELIEVMKNHHIFDRFLEYEDVSISDEPKDNKFDSFESGEQLRCSSCGAAYDIKHMKGDFIKCEYCNVKKKL